ncbi:MAG: hypothetical protein GY869_09785 [Planctomycetes bacterium]|nr:hypothetical protein [Planctomycetota bacterium]
MQHKIIIDKEFESIMRDVSLSGEQLKGLQESLLEVGLLDPLIVWETKEGEILIDGHNRYKICTDNDILIKTEALEFDGRDEACKWIVEHQCNRRNITREQMAILRGKQFEREKKNATDNLKKRWHGQRKEGKNSPKGQNEPSEKTAEKIAKQHGVSEATIKRDAQFTKALERIEKFVGVDVKEKILAGKSGFSKSEIIKYGNKWSGVKLRSLFKKGKPPKYTESGEKAKPKKSRLKLKKADEVHDGMRVMVWESLRKYFLAEESGNKRMQRNYMTNIKHWMLK